MTPTRSEFVRKALAAYRARRREYATLTFVAVMIMVSVALGLHQRGIAATHTERVLDCQYAGSGAHKHDNSCYDAAGNLVCPLQEREYHVHDDSCYTESRELACGLEEHQHSEACYDEDGNLTCEQDEHQHTDDCYQVTRELTCKKDEVAETHVHGPGCFREVTVDDGETEADQLETQSAVAEGAQPDGENAMPEQTFAGELKERDKDGNERVILTVNIKAPEGAFPADTQLVMKAIEGNELQDALQAIDEAVKQKDSTATGISWMRAVGFSFEDSFGTEVRPQKKVELKITHDRIRSMEEPVLARTLDAQAKATFDKTEDAEVLNSAVVTNLLEEDTSTGNEDTFTLQTKVPGTYAIVEVAHEDETVVEDAGQVDDSENDVVAVTMPPQQFVHQFTNADGELVMKITVDAPEGALPAGTTMQASWIDPNAMDDATHEALDQVLAAKSDGKLIDLQAVDITFVDETGAIVEPARDVTVTFTSSLVNTNDETTVVHVESESEALARAEQQGTGDTAIQAEVMDALSKKELSRRDVTLAADELAFEAGQFSTYVLAVTTREHTLTTDGGTVKVTVEIPAEAGIPADAELVVEEIPQDSKEYEDYLADSREALGLEAAPADEVTEPQESENEEPTLVRGVDYQDEDVVDGYVYHIVDIEPSEQNDLQGRFFDISLKRGDEELEPLAPVEVKIEYVDPVEVPEGAHIQAVHFADDGTEVLEVEASGSPVTEVSFTQDSFSVTGTLVSTNNTYWPNNTGRYILYFTEGGNSYAIKHDGTLTPVTISNNNIIFNDTDDGDSVNRDYAWDYTIANGDRDRYLSYGGLYIDPRAANGIGPEPRTLRRYSSGAVDTPADYYNNLPQVYLYRTNDFSSLAGQSTNSNQRISVQFAQAIQVPNNVIIHYVDRDGNPIEGVTYNGTNTRVTSNDDGTFTIPLDWGGTTGTIDLGADFSKVGYTYANTHLAGIREGEQLTHDGMAMDQKIESRGRAIRIWTDNRRSDNIKYGNLRAIDDLAAGIQTISSDGSSNVNYAAQGSKDIYVILDPVPTGTGEGQQGGIGDVEDPKFNKTLTYNEDGTYQLDLSVTAPAKQGGSDNKANVVIIVDTSSSMNGTDTGTGYSRLHDTKEEVDSFVGQLLSNNDPNASDPTVEVALVSFDGGVKDEIHELTGETSWTSSETTFDSALSALEMHRGTDWEDGLKLAYEVAKAKQQAEPNEQVFVVFFTDGEPSQYTSYHGAQDFNPGHTEYGYGKWYNYFLCREASKDEIRAIVNDGMTFFGIYAYNQSSTTYTPTKENGKTFLHDAIKYGYGYSPYIDPTHETVNLTDKYFFDVSETSDLNAAFTSILRSITASVGFTNIVMHDDVTPLTTTGLDELASGLTAVDNLVYKRSGGTYGEGETWTPAANQLATYDETNGITWNLSNLQLENGVTYTVSIPVWPSQEAYDWLANLRNGTTTWQDVKDAGLDYPNGANPQFVRIPDVDNASSYSYSLRSNPPSKDTNGNIINNEITYTKTRSETVDDMPEGYTAGVTKQFFDDDGNLIEEITYTPRHDGEYTSYTKTTVTYKTTAFPDPTPMPLVPEKISVTKGWDNSMNTSHMALQLKFRVKVGDKYYQNDGTLAAGTDNAMVLQVNDGSPAGDVTGWVPSNPAWTAMLNIAAGIVRYDTSQLPDDDQGNPVAEVLETGHKYTLEEFELSEIKDGIRYDYDGSYEFRSQTVRPMILDGKLAYLMLVDEHNPAPAGERTYTIDGEQYYNATRVTNEGTEQETREGVLTGTNHRRAELDITKVVKGNNNFTVTELGNEAFTYRITLEIPAYEDASGIMGYEWVPRYDVSEPNNTNRFHVTGYQGEANFSTTNTETGTQPMTNGDDTTRFKNRVFGRWQSQLFRLFVKTQTTGGSTTAIRDTEGNPTWLDGLEETTHGSKTYKKVTFYMTLKADEILRLTNLPWDTIYTIEEIYVNKMTADDGDNYPVPNTTGAGASNLTEAGYEVEKVNYAGPSTAGVTRTGSVVTGTISELNTRYYHQFVNKMNEDNDVEYAELKATKALSGLDWGDLPEDTKFHFTLAAGTATYSDGGDPATGTSPMPATTSFDIDKNTPDYTKSFGKARYDRPGTYTYTITEDNAGTTVDGLTYGLAETVTVTVVKNNGTLVVQSIQGDNARTAFVAATGETWAVGTTTITNVKVKAPLALVKIGDGQDTNKLDGAEFDLYTTYVGPDSADNVKAKDVVTGQDIPTITSVKTTPVTIGTLAMGDYYLVETKAPDGYNMLGEPVTIHIQASNDAPWYTVSYDQEGRPSGNLSMTNNVFEITVDNTSGVELPAAGGPGTMVFIICGIALLVGGAMVLLARRQVSVLQ